MKLTPRQRQTLASKPYRLRQQDGRNIAVQYDHLPGKWKSTKTDDVDDAIAFADSMLQKVGLMGYTSIPTFGKYAADFFIRTDDDSLFAEDQLWKRRRNASFYEQHHARVANYLIPEFGNVLLDSITAMQIKAFMIRLAKTSLADSTKNKILMCLRIILDKSVLDGFRVDNPAKEIKLINAETKTERHPFSRDELCLMFPPDDSQLISNWGGLMWASYFLVLRDTGFRPGEIAGLQKRHYYPELRGLYTDQDVNYKTREVQPRIKTTGKGQAYKVGMLTRRTCMYLDQLTANFGDDDFLFRTSAGNLIIATNGMDRFRETCDLLGIKRDKGKVQYSFRHTFNNNIIGEIDETIRQILMGHAGKRPEYDHRLPEKLIKQVSSFQPSLEQMWRFCDGGGAC